MRTLDPVLAAILLAVSLASQLLHAAAAAAPSSGETALSETAVIFNLYDLGRTQVVQQTVDALAPLVRPADIFALVSGNHKGPPDVPAVARWAETLHKRFPESAVWVLTSGLANVKALAAARDAIPACVSTIVYDYEPKWDNEPEFDADLSKTIANFTQAVSLAHSGRFALAGAPTGRPLLKPDFARFGWDYGKVAREAGADGMLVQTQTYCKKGVEEFQTALAKLGAQQTAAGLPLGRVYPQVTVDPQATNGVPVAQAVACVREARRAGFARVSLWFAPARVDKAVEFLEVLGRRR